MSSDFATGVRERFERRSGRAVRRQRRVVAVLLIGPVTMFAGLVWAIAQPYRIAFRYPEGKNVYASKPKAGRRYPNGAVIVKTIARPGDGKARPSQVAVMRKVNGRWRFVEYELSGSRYTTLAQGQLCVSCHMQAKSNDYVFTKR